MNELHASITLIGALVRRNKKKKGKKADEELWRGAYESNNLPHRLAHLSKLIKGWIKYDGASTKAGENYEREQPHARRFAARNGRESDCLPPYISYRWKSEIRLIS